MTWRRHVKKCRHEGDLDPAGPVSARNPGRQGVLTDIDETVSTHSQLTAEAYGAMEALKKAGFRVIR